MMTSHFSRNKFPLNFSVVMIRKLVPVKKKKLKIIIIKLSVLNAFPGNGVKILLDHKGCNPKCRFSQVINHGKSKVDPQGMIRHERIILTILQKRKINNKKKIGIFAFGFHSKVEQRNII
jgi:hypothetical protein